VWQTDVINADDGEAYMEALETELLDLRALHASIIEQGRLVQIGASGESEHGAMSDSRYIEWVKGRLEGND
jgi:hypothetical protein